MNLFEFFHELINNIFVISGIWYSSYYLGAFIGPTLGGVLINIYGFDSMTMVFAIMFGSLFGINMLELLYKRYISNKSHLIYKPLDVQDNVQSKYC